MQEGISQQFGIGYGQQQIFFCKRPDMIGCMKAYQIDDLIICNVEGFSCTGHVIPVLEFETELPETFLIYIIKGEDCRLCCRRESPAADGKPGIYRGGIMSGTSVQQTFCLGADKEDIRIADQREIGAGSLCFLCKVIPIFIDIRLWQGNDLRRVVRISHMGIKELFLLTADVCVVE